MRKAFTLIELLVVIAIIAILAAILFPVFVQAKVSAKKTAGISNNSQIVKGIMLYMSDSDDFYPRNDDCVDKSSLNPDLNKKAFNPTGPGCLGPYYYRVNHYSWQKWVRPYVKNVEIFEHPGRQKLKTPWLADGELMGGFSLNLALTGANNSYNKGQNASDQLRDSWLGGSQTAVPSVAEAMLVFEFSNPDIDFAPVIMKSSDGGKPRQTAYPFAIKEFWRANFKQLDKNCNPSDTDDERLVFGHVIICGMADGHSKALTTNRFVALTPTAAQYGVPLDNNLKCGYMYSGGSSGGNIWVNTGPNWTEPWPFWGLN